MHMLWFYYIIVNRLSLSAIFALTHSNSWGIIKTEFGGNYFVLGQYVCLNFISKYIEDTLYECDYCTTSFNHKMHVYQARLGNFIFPRTIKTS